jgi:hypothetical protein
MRNPEKARLRRLIHAKLSGQARNDALRLLNRGLGESSGNNFIEQLELLPDRKKPFAPIDENGNQWRSGNRKGEA